MVYCVECPQYSIRLEALAVYFVHSMRPKFQGLVSRDSTVDRQFVTAWWESEWLILGLCAVRCRQLSSDVAENLGRFLVRMYRTGE